MNRQKMLKQTIAMRTGQLTMNREGEYWVPEELEMVQKQFFAGIPVNEIAIELERSEEEVYQQIRQMRLYTAPSRSRGKCYTSFGGYVRFPAIGKTDSPCFDGLYYQRHIQVGYVDV